jgi:hypothetical protein
MIAFMSSRGGFSPSSRTAAHRANALRGTIGFTLDFLVASFFEDSFGMDTLNGAGLGARRNEDIALDLMKFVAGTTGVGKLAAPSTGFTGPAAIKTDEQVAQLLELYGRCLKAVQGA